MSKGHLPRRVIDVSVPNGPAQHVYPGDPEPRIEPVRRIAGGDPCNLSLLHLGSHTGTHVDAPYHFLADGPRLGQVPLDRMVGPCVVADLRGRPALDGSAFRDAPIERDDIVVCLTDNSARWNAPGFQKDFVYVTADGAEALLARGVRALGMDYLSIEEFGSPDFPVHHRLLGAGVFVIEGLDLRQVAPGRYYLVCLPLKFPDLDGAPARAVLLEY
jgi:arylformamidase